MTLAARGHFRVQLCQGACTALAGPTAQTHWWSCHAITSLNTKLSINKYFEHFPSLSVTSPFSCRATDAVCNSGFALPAAIPGKQDGCRCLTLSTRSQRHTAAQVRASWASSPLRPCPAPGQPLPCGGVTASTPPAIQAMTAGFWLMWQRGSVTRLAPRFPQSKSSCCWGAV